MLAASHRGRLVWRMFKDQSGYSLPEVLVAILLLAIAIIPMVGMFDAGLKAASLGGNYDKARALANKQLEVAKSRPYDYVRTEFPISGTLPGKFGYTSPAQKDVDFPGFTYVVSKQYMEQPPTAPGSSMNNFNSADTDTGLIKVTITVSWGSSNSYTTVGLVGRE